MLPRCLPVFDECFVYASAAAAACARRIRCQMLPQLRVGRCSTYVRVPAAALRPFHLRPCGRGEPRCECRAGRVRCSRPAAVADTKHHRAASRAYVCLHTHSRLLLYCSSYGAASVTRAQRGAGSLAWVAAYLARPRLNHRPVSGVPPQPRHDRCKGQAGRPAAGQI